MPRIEMSLSSDDGLVGAVADDTPCRSACEAWAEAVRESQDACLLLDERGTIFATSQSCRTALGLPGDIDGKQVSLLDSPLKLMNFAASGGALTRWEAERIPPLQALNTGALARGLLRVSVAEIAHTYDVISTPLDGGDATAGSLSFLRHC